MIVIKTYQEENASALWDLFFNTVRKVNRKDYSNEQVTAWAPESFDTDVWKSKMQSLNPFIAEIDDEVVGYSDLQDDGLIDHFFCHYQHQGKGVGSALMTHILELAKERKLPRVYSHVSITAKPFYERFGFTVVKPQRIDVRGEQLINYVMERQIL
ncbi:GNAT family N-acetyltransferase [Aliivibrio fischeri]|uniref:GNAT family N-acetyltransferase n=1 Tax=Aliivibrio fischeri TaxID=668 RepID=UPI0012D93A24|nr:GNAT family N-acetyltransferase [Aliivibrio fischeri]MUJ23721.1 GNAT family N-acetyltransferase [Aliivibrio fischeri]MUK25848.1 GNAT family N-acetyltransferase [Aliivibrio fischeri]MUK34187.1 GNAT family N-acetyltransferase [Aliivibrio fischeri]